MKREIAVRTMPNVRRGNSRGASPAGLHGLTVTRRTARISPLQKSDDAACNVEYGVSHVTYPRMVSADADGDKSGFRKGYEETPDTVTSKQASKNAVR